MKIFKDFFVVFHVAPLPRDVVKGVLTKPEIVLLNLAHVTVGCEDRLSLDAHLLKQIAQNEIIVPRDGQELLELRDGALDPSRLDDHGAVPLEHVERLAVRSWKMSPKIIFKFESRESPCRRGIGPVPLEELRHEAVVIARVVVMQFREESK